jgi:hypothetical protein
MLQRARAVCIVLLLAAGVVIAMTAPAQAQVVRFVSVSGDNDNNCTRSAPCRTLQRGITATPSGGQLLIQDAGNYGNTATIDRSITISAVGVAATVGALTISAPSSDVVLRGLMLTGNAVPVHTSGVHITAARSVHIVRCEIERFSGNASGILIEADNTEIFVSDTLVRNNEFYGLELTTLSTGVQLTIDNSRFENNGEDGIRIVSSSQTSMTRVVVSGNDENGIAVSSGRVNVTSSTIANNIRDGVLVGTSGDVTMDSSVSRGHFGAGFRTTGGVGRVGSSVLTGNATGLEHAGGTLLSRRNNTVSGNTTATSGTITSLGGL